MPAKSWDSYKDTLYEVLAEIKPRYVLEFGTGLSTEIISAQVEALESVEHDWEYYKKAQENARPNTHIIYEPNLDLYAQHIPQFRPELVFVDGRNRARCLREVRRYGCPVILHDAGREQYREAAEIYRHAVWTDQGETVVLCDDQATHGRLLKCLAPYLHPAHTDLTA